MPWAQLDNLGRERIFYALHRPRETSNKVPALVCVHGAGGSHLNWPAEIRRLPGAAVYALDLPGHGRSTGTGRETIDEYAAVLVSFLDALSLPDAVVAGHSMGSAVALEMSLSHPERIRGQVLVGGGARLRVAPAILQGILEDFEGAVQIIIDWAYSPDAPADLKRSGRELMNSTSPKVMHGDLLACDAFDVMDRLGEIHTPTLVIAGTADRLTPVKYATFLAQHVAGAESLLIENAGHMVMLERPQEVGAAVSHFVASL
jgi:pimeloyl-ACP methyl ester carboxylesterase